MHLSKLTLILKKFVTSGKSVIIKSLNKTIALFHPKKIIKPINLYIHPFIKKKKIKTN
jgi:hypothetical protein